LVEYADLTALRNEAGGDGPPDAVSRPRHYRPTALECVHVRSSLRGSPQPLTGGGVEKMQVFERG
jgi:hypothetical protein